MTKPPYSLTRHWFILPFAAVLFAFAGVSFAHAAKSISQFGITWTFDREYPSGQFANGDYWVVGPVTIQSITPRPVSALSHAMHGSMVNPVPNSSQGYDNRIKDNAYDPAKNAGTTLPLRLPPGSSLLSSESHLLRTLGDKPQLKTIAILTVLGAPAPAGSFRPPYVGNDKTLRWNKSQLRYDKLRSLPKVPYAPPPSGVAGKFERPWIEQGTTWVSRYLHPSANQPLYGREIAHAVGQAVLALQLDFPNSEKEKLLIRLVQYGIDIYGSARAGAIWPAGGGHNHGRKLPLLLAGAVLNDANMLAYADGRRLIFQEDRQTWYVSQADVGRPLYTADGRRRDEYIQSDVGIPEWGEKHYPEPRWDGRNWNAYYRTVAGSSTIGHVLAARLMGLKETWNWPATFDYYDRYWSIEGKRASSGANSIQPFVAEMWKAYRGATPIDYNDDNVATAIWHNTPVAPQTGSFTTAFDIVPSANKIESVTGLSNGAANGLGDLAAAVRFAPTGTIDARNGSVYQAAVKVPYLAGRNYHIVMSVNLATKRYSVTVTPAGGAAVRIADGWKFETAQAGVSLLNNVGFYATSGYHAVLDIGIEPAGTPASPPAGPTPGAANALAGSLTSSKAWQNVGIPSIGSKATISFDMVAAGNPVDTVTAMTSGAANAYSDLAVAIRFASTGRIDAVNGSTWASAASLKYVAGKVYRVNVAIDVATRRYSVTVTPAGSAPVTIAKNWRFRSSQANVAQLSHVAVFAARGRHTVSNGTLQTN